MSAAQPTERQDDTPLLAVENLSVTLPIGNRQSVAAVRSVSFQLGHGERLGVVGESGSGKSVTARAIAGLLPGSRGTKVAGSIRFRGEELVGAKETRWEQVRRREVGMVFQDPATFLNPTMRIGKQVREALLKGNLRDGSDSVLFETLQLAGLKDPQELVQRYPFQLSGGMRQRVLIAIALAKRPDLIIADEPTTALDATVQRYVLRSIDDSVTKLGSSLLLITHDLGVVAGLCDRVCVMYRGAVVETGTVEDIFHRPQHPYTKELLACVSSLYDSSDTFYVSRYEEAQ